MTDGEKRPITVKMMVCWNKHLLLSPCQGNRSCLWIRACRTAGGEGGGGRTDCLGIIIILESILLLLLINITEFFSPIPNVLLEKEQSDPFYVVGFKTSPQLLKLLCDLWNRFWWYRHYVSHVVCCGWVSSSPTSTFFFINDVKVLNNDLRSLWHGKIS